MADAVEVLLGWGLGELNVVFLDTKWGFFVRNQPWLRVLLAGSLGL